MENCLDSTNPQWENYVSPQFHLIIFIVARLCSSTLTWIRTSTLTWIIDIFASVFLFFGTYERKKILEVQSWTHDCHAAQTSDYEPVSNYFVFSLVSWLAIVILETNSCIYVLNAAFGRIRMNRTIGQWLKVCGSFVFAANSVIVMLHFCTDVHQTFDCLTKDVGLVLYFWVAAFIKTSSIFLQGVFFCSWFIDHPFQFLPRDHFHGSVVMFRMALVNLMDIVHVGSLAYFGILDGHSLWTFGKMTRIASLLIDIIYRVCLLSWYLANSYFLFPMIQRLLRNLNVFYERFFFQQLRVEGDRDLPVIECAHNAMDANTLNNQVLKLPTQVETYDGEGELVICGCSSRVMGSLDNQLITDGGGELVICGCSSRVMGSLDNLLIILTIIETNRTEYVVNELMLGRSSYKRLFRLVYVDSFHLLAREYADEQTYCATPPAQVSNRFRFHRSKLVVGVG